MSQRSPIAIDVFSGAGGLSLGLRAAGFDVRLATDNDPAAVRTYQQNLEKHVIAKSVCDLRGSEILSAAGVRVGDCDLLAGGPPCQGFSVQRRGHDRDDRNRLIFEFLRLVEELRPRFFLMENVPGLLSNRGREFFRHLTSRTKELGYEVLFKKLDAVNFGVPQFRRRVFLVGELDPAHGALFCFPEPDPNSCWRTVRDAIGDLPAPPVDGSPHPEIANHYRESRLSKLNIERLRYIPPGGGREHLPEHLRLPCHTNNPTHRHVDVNGRLAWDRPATTITARFDSFTRGRFAHPEQHRSITLREGARLQTFPDDFVFLGSREECARQIGNAVPPLLAERLGRSVITALHGDSVHPLSPRQIELGLPPVMKSAG